jgi:hypothetical protein
MYLVQWSVFFSFHSAHWEKYNTGVSTPKFDEYMQFDENMKFDNLDMSFTLSYPGVDFFYHFRPKSFRITY